MVQGSWVLEEVSHVDLDKGQEPQIIARQEFARIARQRNGIQRRQRSSPVRDPFLGQLDQACDAISPRSSVDVYADSELSRWRHDL